MGQGSGAGKWEGGERWRPRQGERWVYGYGGPGRKVAARGGCGERRRGCRCGCGRWRCGMVVAGRAGPVVWQARGGAGRCRGGAVNGYRGGGRQKKKKKRKGGGNTRSNNP